VLLPSSSACGLAAHRVGLVLCLVHRAASLPCQDRVRTPRPPLRTPPLSVHCGPVVFQMCPLFRKRPDRRRRYLLLYIDRSAPCGADTFLPMRGCRAWLGARSGLDHVDRVVASLTRNQQSARRPCPTDRGPAVHLNVGPGSCGRARFRPSARVAVGGRRRRYRTGHRADRGHHRRTGMVRRPHLRQRRAPHRRQGQAAGRPARLTPAGQMTAMVAPIRHPVSV
jgi:hypothetical protein